MKYATFLAAIVLLVGCGSKLDGTYTDKNGMFELTFNSNGTVIHNTMGVQVELKYDVDGKKIKIGTPQGSVIYTMLDNGSISGPMGIVLAKKSGAQSAASSASNSGNEKARIQVSEAIALLSASKTPCTEYFQDKKKWPDKMEDVMERTSGKFTQTIEISSGAGGTGDIQITATLGSANVDSRVAGKKVAMRSTAGGKAWQCVSVSVPKEYLPAACQ